MSLKNIHKFNPSTSSVENSTHTYKQVMLYNNNENPFAPAIPAIFQQVQLSSVIENASDYYASIVRWSTFSDLPVIIPDILTGIAKAYDGETKYWCGIYKTGQATNSTQNNIVNVIYNPATNPTNNYTRPLVFPSNQAEAYNNPYFYISNINTFLALINTALATAMINVGLPANKHTPPRFAYNSALDKIELMVNNIDFGLNSTNPTLPAYSVAINQQLFNILASFHLEKLPDVPNGGTTNNGMNTITTIGTGNVIIPGNYYIFKANDDLGRNSFVSAPKLVSTEVIDVLQQTNSSIPAMSPVDSVQMETATIPVENTLQGSPSFLGPPQNNLAATQNARAILTSYQVNLVSGCEYSQGYIQYTPSGPYRLIDCLSNGNITNLQITITWMDKLGSSHYFLIPNNQSASMLLMFRKKSFNGRP